MNPTKQQIFEFVEKFNNPKHCAIVTQVPINELNMWLIDGLRKMLKCELRLRWRGDGWKPGYLTKDKAKRVSVYPRDTRFNFELRNHVPTHKYIVKKYHYEEWIYEKF